MLLLKGFASFVSVALNSSALPWPMEEATRDSSAVSHASSSVWILISTAWVFSYLLNFTFFKE